MTPAQAILLGAAISAIVILAALFLLRRPIVKAIEDGRLFGIDIGPKGARLLVGPAVHDEPPPSAPGPTPLVAKSDDIPDPKLVRFVPPFPPGKFRIVPLPRPEPPPFFNWRYVPTGKIVIYDIPFFLLPVGDPLGNLMGHLVMTAQPSQLNEADIKQVDMQATRAVAVHFLISAGHGWRSHEGVDFLYKRVGHIDFGFRDGSSQRCDLVLGRNLREWAFGNSTNLVTEIDLAAAKPAWLSHDSTKRFDFLTVAIDGGPRDLVAITLVGKFEHDHPGKVISTPAAIISAATVERDA